MISRTKIITSLIIIVSSQLWVWCVWSRVAVLGRFPAAGWAGLVTMSSICCDTACSGFHCCASLEKDIFLSLIVERIWCPPGNGDLRAVAAL